MGTPCSKSRSSRSKYLTKQNPEITHTSKRPHPIPKLYSILDEDFCDHKSYKADRLKLKNINKIEYLYGFESKSTIKPFRRLVSVINSSQGLCSLSLDISNIRSNDISNLLRSHRRVCSLKSFTLTVHQNRFIANQVLNQIVCYLKTVRSLRSLMFDFHDCSNINKDGITILYGSLRCIHSLHSLNLSLRDIKLEDINLKQLSLCLNNHPHLVSLSLDFSDCSKITDRGIAYLSLRQLSSLRSLGLSFQKCSGLSNIAFENEGLGIRHLTLLSELKIDLYWCSNITDRSIESLSEELRHLPSLSSLSLNLDHCSKISYAYTILLCKTLRDIKPSLRLDLNLNWHWNIADAGVEALSEELKRLDELSKLTMNLSPCRNLTDRGIEKLLSQFRSLKQLQYLAVYLNLNQSNGITEKGSESYLLN